MDFNKIWEAFKSVFKAKGIELGDNESAIKDELKKVVDETPAGQEIDFSKLDLSKFNGSDNGKLLEALVNRQQGLEAKLGELVTYMKEESEARKADKEKTANDAKTKKEEDVKKAVDFVIGEKKAFPESQRENLMKLATADLDNFKAVYGEAKPDKHFQDDKKEAGADKKETPVRSTLGNAKIMESIKGFQAQSESVEASANGSAANDSK